MIEAIVFDIGGVFFEKADPLRNQVLEQYQISEEWLARVRQMPAYKEYKDGYMTRDDFMSHVDPMLRPGVGRATDLFRALSLARDLNRDLVNLTHRLKTRYRVAVLSNSDSFLEERLQHFGVWDLFEFVINSYRVRLRKPDPRIFEHLLDRIELEPGKILFIDDKVANVSVARDLGMHGHVFSNNADLTQHLAMAGISV